LNSHNTPFKFNAKELDDETGNYYYGARYYNPKWNVWLSVDPLAEDAPDWTPYRYGFHNPLRFIDPTGMSEGDHEYTMDKNGKIEKVKHVEGSTTDNLHTKENWDKGDTSKGVNIEDQSVLAQLSVTNGDFRSYTPWGYKVGRYAETTNKKDFFKILYFASKNSDVEWAGREYKNNNLNVIYYGG
jgi:RHS repeat-associated protein